MPSIEKPRVPLHDRPLRFLDCETLGVAEHHPIIEIAILDENGSTLLDTLVKPPPSFDRSWADPVALEYSGFNEPDRKALWETAPELDSIAPEIIVALDGCQVWGQTSQFDVWKLRHWLRLYNVDFPPNLGVPCFNVETLAAEHLPSLTHFSLVSVANALGLDVGRSHRARSDANTARLVHQKLLRATDIDRAVYSRSIEADNRRRRVEEEASGHRRALEEAQRQQALDDRRDRDDGHREEPDPDDDSHYGWNDTRLP